MDHNKFRKILSDSWALSWLLAALHATSSSMGNFLDRRLTHEARSAWSFEDKSSRAHPLEVLVARVILRSNNKHNRNHAFWLNKNVDAKSRWEFQDCSASSWPNFERGRRERVVRGVANQVCDVLVARLDDSWPTRPTRSCFSQEVNPLNKLFAHYS